MTVHRLKSDRPHYQHVAEGTKRYEARLDDRRYRAGDTLELAERDPRSGRLTGREQTRIVTHVLRRAEAPWSLTELERHGLAILTIEPPDAYEGSSQNPQIAAREIPEPRLQAAIQLLRERFSLAWSELTDAEREDRYRDVARHILQIP